MNVFELADYVAYTAALLVGIRVGRRMRPKPTDPIKPVCTCDHGYGQHENGARCYAIDHPYLGNDRYDKRPCTCRRYDGPDPAIFGLEIP